MGLFSKNKERKGYTSIDSYLKENNLDNDIKSVTNFNIFFMDGEEEDFYLEDHMLLKFKNFIENPEKDFLVLKYYSSLYSDGFSLEEITLMRHGICRFRIDSEKENILVSDS
ncbi:hypothetical protein ACV3V9_03970 [Clostridium perfringens]